MFVINAKSKNAIYEQIKEQIKQYISIGILQPNDKLPSVRNLAEELGINPNTVAKAYSELEQENIIISQYKKGYFIGVMDVQNEVKTKMMDTFENDILLLQKLGIEKEKLIEAIEALYQKEG